MGPLNEPICFASKLNYVQFDFPFALKLLSRSLPLWNLHKLSIYTVLHVSLLHLVTEQLSTSQSLSLSLTRSRSPLTSQALTGIRELQSPSTISTLKAIMNTWQPSGQWVMSSRTTTGKPKPQVNRDEILSKSKAFWKSQDRLHAPGICWIKTIKQTKNLEQNYWIFWWYRAAGSLL